MPQLPSLPRVRDSLLAFADRLASFPLALVVAPAGSGKSTLLAAWQRRLHELGETFAYLDLSPLHADAAVLIADLLETVRHAMPHFGVETARALASLSGEADEWRVLLRAWLRDWSRDSLPLVLVLDNFHEVAGDASSARLLDEWLRTSPSNLHLVVASRGAVPGSAARLRAAGLVQAVGIDDLSLRFEEVERVLAEHGAADDPDLTTRVLARTAGWAAGVQLAARRIARIDAADRAAFVAQLAGEPDLFRFVATEVLRDEPDAVLAAVDAVSLLGRCRAEDVAELLGDPRAVESVARAVQRGVLLSDGTEVYLHQLWRDLLSDRLAARLGKAERRPLLIRAGALLRKRKQFEGALEAFTTAEAWEPMAQTLVEAAEPWAREGRAERLRFWLARLPDGLVDETPGLLTLRGVASMRSAPQQALPILERAAQMYRARGDRVHERALAGYLGMLYLAQMRRGDALRVLRRMITIRGVVTDPAERGGLYSMLAQRRYLTGRFGGALSMAERAASMPLDAAADWFNTMLIAWLRSARGEWDVARAQIDRVLQRPEVAAYSFLANGARLQHARIAAQSGDPAAALEEAELVADGFRDHRLPMLRETVALVIGFAKSRLGDRAGARQAFEEALARASSDGGGAEGPVRAQLAMELLRWGEADEARREAERALAALGAPGERWSVLMPWLLGYALWVLARSGDPEAAWKLAQRHRTALSEPALGLAHHTMLLVQADLAHLAGDESEARRRARDAFEFAARFGVRALDPGIGDLLTPDWAAWAIREGICVDEAFARLAMAAPARIAPLLRALVRDRDTETRLRAVRLLARGGGRPAFEPLREASADRVARVRDAAAAALAGLDLRPTFVLRVHSLGALELFRGEQPVTQEAWKGQTARRLFARLLVAEGRAVARERLREELWPDAEPEAGRNNLRVATTRLNDALDPQRPTGAAPHFVVAEGDALRLSGDALANWDVAAFRARLREADDAERRGEDTRMLAAARAAIALYRGPFLDNFDEEWVLALRRDLAERFAAIAHRVGPRLLRRGRSDEASALADRLLTADPSDERAFALRMRAQLARGDRSGALRSYEEAAAVLRRELAVEPGAELDRLAAQARANA